MGRVGLEPTMPFGARLKVWGDTNFTTDPSVLLFRNCEESLYPINLMIWPSILKNVECLPN